MFKFSRIKIKKTFICFAFVVFLFLCAQVVYANMGPIRDTPLKKLSDGFRDMKWGDPPSKLGTDVRVVEEYTHDDKSFITYEKQKDDLVLGEAHLKTIQYLFVFRQRTGFNFYRVNIVADDGKNSALLEDYAVQALGSDYIVSDNKRSIHWEGIDEVAYFDRDRKTMAIFLKW
jgi:hypothetical protein